MAADHIDTLTSIALVTTAALLCGLALIRLRQPAIVGYILAGVALGPTGLKLVSNTETVQVLAELGVIMLLFLIGMELSLRSFKSVYKTALSVAALQIVAALIVFYGIGHFLDWTLERIVVFAFATALSSTAVAIKILEETDELRTPVGRTTVSVLIAQDLAVIPMLLIISAFGSGHAIGSAGATATTTLIIVKLAVAIGLLIAVSWFLSKRDRVDLPMSGWIMSRHEVIPLAALAFCFTWATLSGLIGLSTAYGAFLAGLVIGNSNVRATMHKAAEPIQTILLMVFFLSIGLLIDLDYIFANWKNVLLVLAIVTFLKTFVNVGILHLLGEPWRRAFHAGVVMGQLGEFSFILVAGGVAANVISPEGYDLMISVIALSLLISPMWLAVARRLHDMAIRKLGVNILTPAQDE
ncbi:MAG: cation/H(+) antiporter [Alphaproteobacteria bacterium]|jgi:CPA2 family monovalent cation:H+ antiporter-2|nr:cation/H(+) antiporter [Alphaproteobacteria bacterium]